MVSGEKLHKVINQKGQKNKVIEEIIIVKSKIIFNPS